MALQKDYEFKGLTIKNAYHRISEVLINRNSEGVNICTYCVSVSANSSSEQIGNTGRMDEFIYETDSDRNIFQQCYDDLKTTEYYQDAIDV